MSVGELLLNNFKKTNVVNENNCKSFDVVPAPSPLLFMDLVLIDPTLHVIIITPFQQVGMSFSSHVLAIFPAAVIGIISGVKRGVWMTYCG